MNRAMTRQGVVALAGATGMVGTECLPILIETPQASRILVLGRRPPPLMHPRVQAHQLDFTQSPTDATWPVPPEPLAAALCALGTTMKVAKSQAAFRAVDFDAVLMFARWAKGHGCATFVLVSSVGADPTSSNFYLRTKGEVEGAVKAMGFPHVVVLRPGLLLGERSESRPTEAITRAAMPLLGRLLIGKLDRYRGIEAHTVASAMVSAAFSSEVGDHVWENRQILARAARSGG